MSTVDIDEAFEDMWRDEHGEKSYEEHKSRVLTTLKAELLAKMPEILKILECLVVDVVSDEGIPLLKGEKTYAEKAATEITKLIEEL